MTTIVESPEVAAVTDNRDATADDAKVLGRIYRRLDKSTKAHKKASREVADGWVGHDIAALREARDVAQMNLDTVMDESWTAINELPKGTCAPGGATRQTVSLQFYNSNLNRSLKLRITASDARQANKRSFG